MSGSSVLVTEPKDREGRDKQVALTSGVLHNVYNPPMDQTNPSQQPVRREAPCTG